MDTASGTETQHAHQQAYAGKAQAVGEVVDGAEAAVRVLREQGVKDVFGIQGGKAIALFDRLGSSDIRIVHAGQEGGAGHMAQGYAESSGKVGIVLTTSGPGATNVVTPTYDAHMDSVPLVVITCQVNSNEIGSDAFQEAAIFGMMQHCTKHNYLVQRPEELASTLRDAFHIAKTGRPRPVHVDITADCFAKKTVFSPGYSNDYLESKFARKSVDSGGVEAILDALSQAKRPILVFGGGAKDASDLATELVRTTGAPTVTPLKGIGCIPASEERNLGMPGMHGFGYATFSLFSADFVLFMGSRIADRVIPNSAAFISYGRNGKPKTIGHIDIDATEINKRLRPDGGGNGSGPSFYNIPMNCDVRDFLEEILGKVSSGKYDEWYRQIAAWKERYAMPGFMKGRKKTGRSGLMRPQYVMEAFDSLVYGRDDVILTTGVGQQQMFAAQYMRIEAPRRFITSGGAGTMGYGLPAAIGVQAANPGYTVIDLDGDGSFNMNIQELRTVADYNLPVKVVVFHNSTLGMVRQWQDSLFSKRHVATDIGDAIHPDFAKIARGYGIMSRRVSTPRQLMPALKEMLSYRGAYVLDVMVDPDEQVLPAIMPGKRIDEMVTHKG